LSLSESDLIKYLKDLENECKNIKHELFKICWYMRGGVTYQEALALSPSDREIVSQIVKDNLDVTKKTGQPFF
jgi:hypothetical protein